MKADRRDRPRRGLSRRSPASGTQAFTAAAGIAGPAHRDDCSRWCLRVQVLRYGSADSLLGVWVRFAEARDPGAATARLRGSHQSGHDHRDLAEAELAAAATRVQRKPGSMLIGLMVVGASSNVAECLFRWTGPMHGSPVDWIGVGDRPPFHGAPAGWSVSQQA